MTQSTSLPESRTQGVPALSAVIVNYNSGDDLGRCLGSVVGQGEAVEIIVVDNGSQDGSVDRARAEYPDIRVFSEGVNDGFAGGANRGAAVASANVLLFLNPDVILEPGCADALLVALNRGEGRVVCAPLLVDASRQHTEYGFTVDFLGDLVGLRKPKSPLYLSGCALATTREVFATLGGFDPQFFMFIEDVDLCWRALLHGYDIQVVPGARVRHRGGGSTVGGYVTDGRIEITAFRVALRERNTLATLVRCGPLPWVALVVPIRLLRIGVLLLVATMIGRRDLARALAAGVAWNVRRLPELIRQRRAIPASPYGMPRFVDRVDRL